MIRRPVTGTTVYSLFNGKLLHGVIIEVYNQDLDQMRHGYMFRRGFKVKWPNGLSDYQISEYGSTVFSNPDELLAITQDEHKRRETYVIDSCKDFYGLVLKPGDYVAEVNGHEFGGIIDLIYIDNSEFAIPKIRIVNSNGYIIRDDADPRCFTTVKRYLHQKDKEYI